MKFNPYGFAVAVLTFALSMVLVYSVTGVPVTMLDGAFPIFQEEERQYCTQ